MRIPQMSEECEGMGHGVKVMGAGLLKFLQKRLCLSHLACSREKKKKSTRLAVSHHEVNRLVGLD